MHDVMVSYDFAADFPLPGAEEIPGRVLREGLRQLCCPYDAEVELLVVSEEEIRRLNHVTRGIDAVTDVLSYPAVEYLTEGAFDMLRPGDPEAFSPETGRLLLGSIVICATRVYAQAQEYGHTPEREYAFLIVHSLLHLCGYDHMEDAQRERMEAMQERILDAAGYVRG